MFWNQNLSVFLNFTKCNIVHKIYFNTVYLVVYFTYERLQQDQCKIFLYSLMFFFYFKVKDQLVSGIYI